jgi:ribonuclease P protein component
LAEPIVRIRNREQFQEVFKNSQRLHSHFYTLYYRRNNSNTCRLGCIASKANVPTAVARNKAKRVVRERVRLGREQFDGLDFVFVVKKPAREAQSKELHRCLVELLTQLLQHRKKP